LKSKKVDELMRRMVMSIFFFKRMLEEFIEKEVDTF